MVCQSWARHSRSRQFKSLRFPSSSLRFILPQFLDLVSSPNATITPHVREVILQLGTGDHQMTTLLLMRLTSLHALDSISLNGCFSNSSDSPSAEEMAAWLGSFPNLKRIKLSEFMLDSFGQLRNMVNACPVLELLVVHHCRRHTGTPLLEQHTMPEHQTKLCPPLRALRTFNCEFDGELLEWVGTSSSSLRSICIGFETVVRHQVSLGRLLHALGPILEQLSIRHDPFFSRKGEKLVLSRLFCSP